jgi:hypothetical protein
MKGGALIATAALVVSVFQPPDALTFAGRQWVVRGGKGGPGPNYWDKSHAWVDSAGRLHLRLAPKDGQWRCAEVYTKDRLGFGGYEFQIESRLDRLDPNVVLGLFNYPTKDVGGDATHEIDVEFARWGKSEWPIGNYTVWPTEKGRKQTSKTFDFTLLSPHSTHRFDWTPTSIEFQSWNGARNARQDRFGHWKFEPKEPLGAIAQKPMPFHFNLWCFRGRPPTDAQPVEVVIESFTFSPSEVDKSVK